MAATPESIGTAISVDTNVSAGKAGAESPLRQGSKVFSDDRILTDLSGVGQIEFVDKTRLAIGPGSTLTLDRFVYDPKRSKTDIVLGLGKGTFRFMTGVGAHQGYEISTPAATIGVRGTAFDVVIGEDGEMAVAMINGTVEVCSRQSRACQLHDAIGRFLHMTSGGVFSLRDKWDVALMKGVGFASAMPFMVNEALLRPNFRAGANILNRYASIAGQAGQAAGQAIQAPARALQSVPGALQNLNPFRR